MWKPGKVPLVATKTKTAGEVLTHTSRAPTAPATPKADPETVAGRLVLCRLATGFSQGEAAQKLGIKAQSLGDLENGDSKKPSALTLLKMRDKLGYDIDYVMRGKGMPLMPNFEELANEQALLSIFRELRPENKKTVLDMAQGVRRAQGGSSPSDPYPFRPPESPNDN